MGRTGCRLAGTSGWHYPHWRGPFYPPELPKARWLAFYASRLGTVEVNSTFYRLPGPGAAAKWREVAPPGFLYAVKASRFITHHRRLADSGKALALFYERLGGLHDRLGPVLFQLPPGFARDDALLGRFLRALPQGPRHVFEFRDPSWSDPGVYSLLARRNAAVCIHDFSGQLTPWAETADFVYVRLHGPHGRYRGSYPPGDLAAWAGRMADWAGSGLDVFVYFNNDEAGYAAQNALELQAMAGKAEALSSRP